MLFCGQIKCRFLAANQNLSPSARKSRHFLAIVSLILHRPEKRPIFWPGHDCETGDLAREAARLANTPASRSKQAARAMPMGSLRLLCAPSPIYRLYFSLGLSTRMTIFVDRSLNFVLASTEIPVFMDKTAHPIHHNCTSHG